jgi:outer membrane usher protein
VNVCDSAQRAAVITNSGNARTPLGCPSFARTAGVQARPFKQAAGKSSEFPTAISCLNYLSLVKCRDRVLKIAYAIAIFQVGCLPAPASAQLAGSNDDSTAIGSNAPTADDKVEALTESFLQVDLNQQGLNETVLLIRTKDGDILIAGEDLARWRLKLPDQPALQLHDRDYFRLQSFEGIRYGVDEAKQLLSIEFPPTAFKKSYIDRPVRPSALSARPNGVLLNYDLFAQHSNNNTQIAGFFEAGTSTYYGAGTATFMSSRVDGKQKVIRLDSSWTVDQPASLASWRAGDAISRSASSWGRSVRFGGMQYASNFTVQPGLSTMPQQNISGQVALPSTVDIFINKALVQRSEVLPGPFSINHIPVITGSGDLRVVVRDVLGREQVITQAFFSNAKLLRSGLSDFSYEVGKQRNNYAITSNDYGRWLASGTLRHGIADIFTGEVHLEGMSGDQKTLGFNGVVAMPAAATVINGSVAASTSPKGSGYLNSLGFEMKTQGFYVFGRTQVTTRNFSQIGIEPDQLPQHRLSNFSVGYVSNRYGSFGIAYARQDKYDTEKTELMSLSYTTNIAKKAFLGITMFKSFANSPSNSIGAFLLIPIDQRTSVSANTQRVMGSRESSQISAQLQRNLDQDEGFGYRFQASQHGSQQAEVSAQNRIGSATAAVEMQNGRTATRASVSGSLIALEGSVFASKRIFDSYALVQVPGFSNVRVYADNQLVGRTDEDGNALISRVRSYEKNPISIESLDLPLSTKIGTLKLDAVPSYRSGVVLRFPVQLANGGTLKILLADGSVLPVGAQVQINQQDEIFPVGLEGEVYLSGLLESNLLRVTWRGSSCQIPLSYLPSKDPVPFLGTFQCKGVKP